MMRTRSAVAVLAMLSAVALAGCTSQKDVGGAYGEGVGGAYEEKVWAEEAPAAAPAPIEQTLAGLRYPAPASQVPPSTEQYPQAAPSPVKSVAQDPVSTFSIDVDTASYANVRRFIEEGRLPPPEAVRVEELINYFDYDYPLPKARKRPFEASVALAPSPWGKDRSLLHIGLQGYEIPARQRPDLNLVLLVDVSGSMEPQDRLPLVQRALWKLVDELRDRDHVAMVVYAGQAGTVLAPTPGRDKAKIVDAIQRLSAGGSTAGGQGIELAYQLAETHLRKGAVNRVVLATDGDFNVGISDPDALEAFVAKKRETGIYLSVLGVGRGNYQDLRMQKLAQAGNGNAYYIDTLSEARKVLHDEIGAALLPIADDVKIQVEFNPDRVAEYRLIGYETRALRREDFSNDRVDAGEIGSGANVTAIYELTPAGGKTLLEPLRYQQSRPASPSRTREIAFLRIRYKPPGAKESVLIERPITDKDAFASLAAAPESTRFATAVAGYGQLLRKERYLDSSFGWRDVIDLASGARGKDEFGWRAGFVQLARDAEMLSQR